MTSRSTTMQKRGTGGLGLASGAVLLALLVMPLHPASAELSVTGEPQTVRVEARGSSLDEILATLAVKFRMQYRANVPLDRPVSGTFAGSLPRVVSRLLDGYDRVVKWNGNDLDIVILGVAAKSPAPEGGQPAAAESPLTVSSTAMTAPARKLRSPVAAAPSLQQTLTATARMQLPNAPAPPPGNIQPAGMPSPQAIAEATRSAGAKLEILRSALGRLPR